MPNTAEPVKKVMAKPANLQKQEQILVQRQDNREAFFKTVGHCTDSLNQFLRAYGRDYGLSQEEIIAAVYLENLNNREFYEKGTGSFDEVCKDTYTWFQENKTK